MSKIEVNAVEPQCGTTLTLGASGDTVTIPSGATLSASKVSGVQAISWQTGSIKTSGFTAAAGEGYFCNTSSSAFTVTLPSGSAGAVVAVSDYTRTFQTNNLTISPQSGEKIGGVAADATLSTEGQTATFVYVDSTEGWINVQETSNSVTGRSFITATGGTITTCGNFKIHTFTGPGTFCVSQISSTAAENTVGYLVVAGGGSGGRSYGGGGGAGGYREGRNVPIDNFTASPLVANAPTNAITLTATAYPIAVGGGGAGVTTGQAAGTTGAASSFSTISAAGGGGGADEAGTPSPKAAKTGGSGGGGGYNPAPSGGAGGAGNTPSVTPPQGTDGGTGYDFTSNGASGGGGGGASGNGSDAQPTNGGGPGANGVASSITGSPVTRAGGGGGGSGPNTPGTFGSGGSGGGTPGRKGSSQPATDAGTANTGGGSGGGSCSGTSGNGGSGVVIIRYKFQ